MIVDILTLNVSCPRCAQKFAETTWYPLSRALEDPDNRQVEDVILATCPTCGCTICVSVDGGTGTKGATASPKKNDNYPASGQMIRNGKTKLFWRRDNFSPPMQERTTKKHPYKQKAVAGAGKTMVPEVIAAGPLSLFLSGPAGPQSPHSAGSDQ